jgi:hypothetical protein
MKKIYTLIATMAVVFSANAQKIVSSTHTHVSSVGMPTVNADRTVTDTIVGYSWTNTAAAGPAFIGSANGGYVVGNNGYGDKQKAQSFLNTIGPVNVEGCIIWFGAKQSDMGSSGTSKVQIKLCALDASGTASTGPVTSAPGTVAATKDLLFTALDTGLSYTTGANTIMFTTPTYEAGDFAISVDFTTLAAGDTVGIVHSTDGDAGATDMSWEQWSDNSWHTLYQAWPLDIDLFLWALVDRSVGIHEQGYLNGVRMAASPNPAVDHTTVTYELQNATDNVSMNLFDINGRLVRTYTEGNKAAGQYSLNIETASLQPGVYYYAITAGKGRIAQKLVVTK